MSSVSTSQFDRMTYAVMLAVPVECAAKTPL